MPSVKSATILDVLRIAEQSTCFLCHFSSSSSRVAVAGSSLVSVLPFAANMQLIASGLVHFASLCSLLSDIPVTLATKTFLTHRRKKSGTKSLLVKGILLFSFICVSLCGPSCNSCSADPQVIQKCLAGGFRSVWCREQPGSSSSGAAHCSQMFFFDKVSYLGRFHLFLPRVVV